VRLHALIPKFDRKEVNTMLILNGRVALLMTLNLAVNTAIGLMILLRCPHVMWPTPTRWPDCLRDKPDLKAEEKGDKSNEQNLG
jgi:hypothetical protein